MSEEVRPFEEYKEMIKDMRKEEMIKGLYDLSANIMKKQKEIERLNNIINELEVFLKEGTELATGCGITKEYIYAYENALDKLQELKGSDKE